MHNYPADGPLEDWERELLDGGHPAPVSTLWSTSSTTGLSANARGDNVTVALSGETDVPGPRRGGSAVVFADLSRAKHSVARHPFSRLSDGERHPVTVRHI